jgi:hypothetical protein
MLAGPKKPATANANTGLPFAPAPVLCLFWPTGAELLSAFYFLKT